MVGFVVICKFLIHHNRDHQKETSWSLSWCEETKLRKFMAKQQMPLNNILATIYIFLQQQAD